jgi:hypothetical protein
MQQRVVEDPVLKELNLPLPKTNAKCVSDFVRRQEAVANVNATWKPKVLVREKHVTSVEFPEALL